MTNDARPFGAMIARLFASMKDQDAIPFRSIFDFVAVSTVTTFPSMKNHEISVFP